MSNPISITRLCNERAAADVETLQKRLRLANKALADIAHLLADIDLPNARAARIGALRTLDATDLVNPNL
jgi:hypothetical protein